MAQTKDLDKKSVEKKAKKALARAEKSVRKARTAVRTSSKKLREQAAELAKKTEKLEAKQSRAARELRSAASALNTRRRVYVPPAAQTRSTASAGGAAELTPPLPAAEPAVPTLAELRQRAKEHGVAGYYRLNKAALIAALDATAAE